MSNITNLKRFFYKEYHQPLINELKKGFDTNKLKNTDLNTSNQALESFTFESDSSKILDLKNHLDLKKDSFEKLDLNFESFTLKTTYPGLLIGSGYPHETGAKAEISLGFFFDHTTGLPVIPGSSIKGALRAAFPKFPLNEKTFNEDVLKQNKANFIGELVGWKEKGTALYKKVHKLEYTIFEGIDFESSSDKELKYFPMPQRDCFFDAFITAGGKDNKILGMDSITPHGDDPLKNPTPIPFIKVLPNVQFKFQFKLNNKGLGVDKKQELFKKIITTLGLGAKTNVGYGQFE